MRTLTTLAATLGAAEADKADNSRQSIGYRTTTDAATAMATRDLAELVELGALRKQGVLKHTRCYLALED